jgi:hypothetical protein
MTFETQTKTLFQAITSDDTKWSPYRQMVANVFNAYPTRALTLEQIEAIARAVECLPGDASLKDAVSFYVRHKVLRSRANNNKGSRLYEVNY